jgi:signal transduction histidine kinase
VITSSDRRRDAIDAAASLTLFVLLVLGVLAARRLTPELADGPLALQLTFGAATTLPLAWRRRQPVIVLGIVALGFGGFRIAAGPEATMSSIALFLALYTVGAELPPERSRWPRGLVVAGAALMVAIGVVAELPSVATQDGAPLADLDRGVLAAFSIITNLAFFVAVWVIGDLVWRSRANERELEARAGQLSASREALAQRAVQDERVRIAQELHDVVAHHVSVMGIQAGAARRAIDRDPVRAGQALSGVEQASRDAVNELHRLLGFLRSNDDVDTTPSPQPTLSELDALVDAVRDIGLEVEVEIRGSRRALPDSVELSAYRIIQEALTNTIRHAEGATRAEVCLDYGRDRLHLTVRDDGRTSRGADPDHPHGRGLLGMRERTALHAGELTASTGPDGGFEVDGWLPIREVVA